MGDNILTLSIYDFGYDWHVAGYFKDQTFAMQFRAKLMEVPGLLVLFPPMLIDCLKSLDVKQKKRLRKILDG